MAFSLTGPRLREALDDETGIRVKSLGPRGPEIETNHWEASCDDLCFRFVTSVGDDDDIVEGRRQVMIWPDKPLIDYLKFGSGNAQDRKALVDRMVEGIAFLFPVVHFRSPISFTRGKATSGYRVGDRHVIEHFDAPLLWDAEPAPRFRRPKA